MGNLCNEEPGTDTPDLFTGVFWPLSHYFMLILTNYIKYMNRFYAKETVK